MKLKKKRRREEEEACHRCPGAVAVVHVVVGEGLARPADAAAARARVVTAATVARLDARFDIFARERNYIELLLAERKCWDPVAAGSTLVVMLEGLEAAVDRAGVKHDPVALALSDRCCLRNDKERKTIVAILLSYRTQLKEAGDLLFCRLQLLRCQLILWYVIQRLVVQLQLRLEDVGACNRFARAVEDVLEVGEQLPKLLLLLRRDGDVEVLGRDAAEEAAGLELHVGVTEVDDWDAVAGGADQALDRLKSVLNLIVHGDERGRRDGAGAYEFHQARFTAGDSYVLCRGQESCYQ
ncbi:6,7-dimethyl-8-ribityllumazine synthase [Frankliniella fusca]|uniref:6,7-dimethyl-8-ribityllumazine synthase n=1 Tax=Frankliniella fusca TaxID=407009 RepID=A0AAE1HBQ4_9NEOP|nr:6,7-dimethyl-8-ribityllumazine synthase [Frankliniella fusca]